MNTQTVITATEQPSLHPIALDFEEGQQVTLLRGAKVNGLTTRTNQPGNIVHIQYSDEFGLTYVVQFGSLGMFAYVGADGIEAVAEQKQAPVTPLLDLYPEVDPGDFLPALLEDITEYLEQDDLVEVNLPGALKPFYGQINRINVECQQALVDCNDGAQRWASIDELTLILKAAALEIETPSMEFESAS